MSDEDMECQRFRTIGEVSEILNIKQYIIRFWEKKFIQIAPVKRRGRRLYDQKNIEIIKQIKVLIYEKGYTIKGVQLRFSTINKHTKGELMSSSVNNVKLSNVLQELIDLRDYVMSKL